MPGGGRYLRRNVSVIDSVRGGHGGVLDPLKTVANHKDIGARADASFKLVGRCFVFHGGSPNGVRDADQVVGDDLVGDGITS